jgi:hypothetical protein
MTEVKRLFMVEGKPFLPVGAEFLCQSGYSARDEAEVEEAFKAITTAHGNAGEFPVFWDQVEPEEGKYDFSSVDTLISLARKNGVKIILVWFATWKNGTMDFAPAWVKTNPKRFKREQAINGKDIWVLSSHCKATIDADKKVFTALCKHLKAKDNAEHTVLALQVENEPNITEQDHDYYPDAMAVFNSTVPAEMVMKMKAKGKGEVWDEWQKAGAKESGTWPELFGQAAGAISHTWGLATCIDAVAKAGKSVYNLPMIINIAGPAVDLKVLDVWKWFTPNVDMIGPDLYIRDQKEYNYVAAKYAREDNPLFVPESFGSSNMLYAIADYNCIGHFFGYLHMNRVYGDTMVISESIFKINLIKCVTALMPLVIKYQGTGKIQAIIQPEKEEVQQLDFEGYTGIVEFGDWRPAYVPRNPPDNNRGAGLVIQVSRNEFYLAGNNCRLHVNAKPPYDKVQAPKVTARWKYGIGVGYTISIEEGHFDDNGAFVADRRRNGDETYHGAWVEPNIGVVRVIMCDV